MCGSLKVLHVTPTFYPATRFGGPIRSTYGLCNALARSGIKLRVLTTDAAGVRLADRINVARFPSWFAAGYEVYVTRRRLAAEIAPGLLVHLVGLMRWADVVHLTGAYSFPTIPTLFAAKLMGKPMVWSLRGAVQAASHREATRPRLKLAWELVCRCVMPSKTCLHVTSQLERSATAARFAGIETAVIANGVDIPDDHRLRNRTLGSKSERRYRLLFVGRIAPVKALENLIEAMALSGDEAMELMICGSGDVAYVARLRQLATHLRVAHRVCFRGHVGGDIKHRAFLDADVFVLPSHSESFSMAVAEALAHGLPVIVARGTPWSEVEVRRCGVWVENDPACLAAAIDDMRRRDRLAMGLAGRSWMQNEFNWPKIAAQTANLYRYLMQNRRASEAPPYCDSA